MRFYQKIKAAKSRSYSVFVWSGIILTQNDKKVQHNISTNYDKKIICHHAIMILCRHDGTFGLNKKETA